MSSKTYKETLLEQMNALRCCPGDDCTGCPNNRQDEGDDESWCNADNVIEKAINVIQSLDDNCGLGGK